MEMTIDQVVRRALLETGYTIHMYPYFYNYAMHGLQEMEIDTIGNLKETKLPVSTSYANINPAYIVDVRTINGMQYVPVASTNSISQEAFNLATATSSGKDFRFTFEDSQITVKRAELSHSTRSSITIGNEYEYNGYNFNVHGEPKGRLFGKPAGNSTVWQYNEATKQLFIANATNVSDLYLVYMDASDEKTPSTVVMPIAVEALTQYIRFRHMDAKRSVPAMDKQLARKDYQNAYRLLRSRKYQLTPEDIKDSLKRSYGLAPK